MWLIFNKKKSMDGMLIQFESTNSAVPWFHDYIG